MILQLSPLPEQYYGLALFPGVVIALAMLGAGLLCRQMDGLPLGQAFPLAQSYCRTACSTGGPYLYMRVGFGMAVVAPFLTADNHHLSALNYALQLPSLLLPYITSAVEAGCWLWAGPLT